MSVPGHEPTRARADLIAAAAHAFAERGYHGVSMRDLARSTRRSPATFYSHFASKEELLFSMQRDAFDTLIATTKLALEGVPDPVARLYVLILNHVRFFTANTDVMRVLIHEASALPAKRRELIRQRKTAYYRIARDVVAEIMEAHGDGRLTGARRAAEIERATYSAFGMLNWTYAWYQPEQHGTPVEVARTIHRIAMRGLGQSRSPTRMEEEMERHLAGIDAPALLSRSVRGGKTT